MGEEPTIREPPHRRTIIVRDGHAMREQRLKAARERQLGLQIMTMEQVAARLAGGFIRPIDDDSLRAAIQAAIPETFLGELESIKMLPGMVNAAVDTLQKIWYGAVAFDAPTSSEPRLAAIKALETAVLARLPTPSLVARDLLSAARTRMHHAKNILGPIEIVGLTELEPCWMEMIILLAHHTTVRWGAGPRAIPKWLNPHRISVVSSQPYRPRIETVSAATAYHEAVEALRWARLLLASGRAAPQEIAFASPTPGDYDDFFQSLSLEADLELHFVHGVKITTTFAGQAAAALADILVRGLSRNRIRRLAALNGEALVLKALPKGWMRVLPDAPLTGYGAWDRLCARLTAADWPDGKDHATDLRSLAVLLAKGVTAAAEAGEACLTGLALAIWRKALIAGPAETLDVTLEAMRQDDELEPGVSMAWMPAGTLAASPRRFVRLLGLNAGRWPRRSSEDRLLPDHIIPAAELDPLPAALMDRQDFQTILATTEELVVLSRARRDGDGRLMGRSSLLVDQPAETYLRATAAPEHAFSEADRLLARPAEFAATEEARFAICCWQNWHSYGITPHDGLIRPSHPLLVAILNRTQSASSLRRLLRNPIGFVWSYGLHWRQPKNSADPLTLDPPTFGNLVHAVLDRALQQLAARGSLINSSSAQIFRAVESATALTAAVWETEAGVPPRVIWRRTLDEAQTLALAALTYDEQKLHGAISFSEVPFGGKSPNSMAPLPWDPSREVIIPDTAIRIGGYIDRLDFAAESKQALVRDYKTGKLPSREFILDGGKELQRCLYAFAVKALLGEEVTVNASLFYPREGVDRPLPDPPAALSALISALRAANTNLLAGNALMGPDTGGDYDELRFALPANSPANYRKRKEPSARALLGDAAQIWEQP